MKNNDNTRNTLSNWYNFRIKIIIEGIIVGIFSGLIVTAYRYALEKSLEFGKNIYAIELKIHWLIPIYFCILIISGYLVGRIIKNDWMISGSGIPQVEGVLLRKFNMNWLKVIVGKFVAGVMCIGAGLSLGREGPSIQMGAAAGQGVSRIFKRIKLEEKFLITSGASAGLAAAFNAPLAGVIFALEEVHKNFSPLVMTSALASAITADFISKNFFGLKPMFNFQHISVMPLNYYIYIVVLGIILGGLGFVFNKVLLKTQDIYASQKWLSIEMRPIIPFMIAGILGLILPDVLGGGHGIISSLDNSTYTLKILLIILVVKFIFTMISFGSGAPGGIFLPMLVIGALVGTIYGNVLNGIVGMDKTYINNLMILGMAGYFSAVVKAPITGCILITEMTGSFNHLLSMGIVCLTSYVVADIMKSKPVYEALLERMIKKNTNSFIEESKAKVIIEVAVCIGSIIEGKKVREVEWPSQCLIVGIKRGEKEIIPKGTTIIYPGDYLIVLTNEENSSDIKECLSEIAERCIIT